MQSNQLPQIRRIVTGHRHDGEAVILQATPPTHVTRPSIQPGLAFHEIWSTDSNPAPITFEQKDPTDTHRDTAPPRNGTVIRIIDIPPEGKDGPGFDKAQAEELFGAVGLAENAEHTIPGRHPMMHRTQSVDYGLVLFGEVTLLLDEEEVDLKPGDVVVQRGTIHAWSNRSDNMCRMAFILVDGTFDEDLVKVQQSFEAAVKQKLDGH